MEIDDDVQEESKFVVEIPTPDVLPVSVATFLTLVENNIYNDLEFLSTQSIIQLDSDEGKVASLAQVPSALSLVEAASAGPCTPYSIGFIGTHGALKIIMTNDPSKHGTLACFGKIAQGRQTVTRIQQATRRGKTVAITSVKTVELTSKPTVGEGEL
jgi:cyclophilin family peptidyl-prolyl cis-trans isomerase